MWPTPASTHVCQFVDQCFKCPVIEHLDICFWLGIAGAAFRNGSLSPIRDLLALGVRFNFPSPLFVGDWIETCYHLPTCCWERLMMRAGDIVIIAMVAVLVQSSSWECHWGSLDPVQLYAGFWDCDSDSHVGRQKFGDRMIKGQTQNPPSRSFWLSSHLVSRPLPTFLIWKSFNSPYTKDSGALAASLSSHFVFLAWNTSDSWNGHLYGCLARSG